MKKATTILCIALFSIFLSSRELDASSNAPTIESVSAAIGNIIYPGDPISIHGKNYLKIVTISNTTTVDDLMADSCSNCKVFINDVEIQNIPSYNWMGISGSDSVIVTIPSNATTGYVQVQNQLGQLSNKFSITITPKCTEDTWSCSNWNTCSVNGTQTRICTKTFDCPSAYTPSPSTTQSCVTTCTANSWSCGNWGACSTNGVKSRSCTKNVICDGGVASPETTQVCTYVPACSADTWQCDNWGVCSTNGIQTRSCNRIYDCPSAETAAPTTSRSCTPTESTNSGATATIEENINRDQILKATVKLKCPIDKQWVSQGSGTVIDEFGTILTNKHVITGTIGSCYVGFIYNEDDIPSYDEIADVKKASNDLSANGDMAILKIRNASGKKFNAVNILQGNSNNLKSGDTIVPFGYPNEDLFGTTITSTEGPYGGKGTTLSVCKGKYNVSGFFKTTATIDHGNSGGGAYQKKTGYFMGIPTLGTSCYPEIPSKVNYILSINTIKTWLNSIGGNYDITKNNYSNLNNYYKETIPIESINLSSLKIVDPSKTTADNNQTQASDNTATKLNGKILLQVEEHGEAWYVNPKDNKKYYMKDGAAAYTLMRYFSLGITNQNLDKIPKVVDTTEMKNSTSACSKYALANQLKGKILLQAEDHGEAWYIEPTKCRAIYLKDGAVAYEIMRFLGLGITNNDLSKIMEGTL